MEASVQPPMVFPKHDLYVYELLLNRQEADIGDDNVWLEINSRVLERFDLNIGGKNWQSRWLNVLDHDIDKQMDLHPVNALPIIQQEDNFQTKLEKGNARLLEFQKLYKQLYHPLAISVCAGNGEDASLLGVDKPYLSLLCIPDTPIVQDAGIKQADMEASASGSATHVHSNAAGGHGTLFQGVEFYLPKSSEFLKEVERWKLQIVILVYGGTILKMEGDIKATTIVLDTGDESGNLWKIPRWYSVKIYMASLIRDCIESKKPIDEILLGKHRYWSQYPNDDIGDSDSSYGESPEYESE